MTDEELADKITRECVHNDDAEGAHIWADQLVVEQLRTLGFSKSADAWTAVHKWYA